MHLYFGCKWDSDFIYKDEILSAQSKGVEVNVAYSQKDKKYVQDMLNMEKIKQIVDKGAKIFICGSTKMGKEVQNKLKEWFGEEFVKGDRVLSEYWGGNAVKFEERFSSTLNL